MRAIDLDKEQLVKDLVDFFCRRCGLGDVNENTPMHEIRARLEKAGEMVGRTVAVVTHEGPIGADIALKIRHEERFYKERCSGAARVCGPQGVLRRIWDERAGRG